MLKENINNVDVYVYEAEMVPTMGKYDSETSKLMIFDDLVLELKKTQVQTGEYFIRGRKQGWSMIYVTQS